MLPKGVVGVRGADAQPGIANKLEGQRPAELCGHELARPQLAVRLLLEPVSQADLIAEGDVLASFAHPRVDGLPEVRRVGLPVPAEHPVLEALLIEGGNAVGFPEGIQEEQAPCLANHAVLHVPVLFRVFRFWKETDPFSR